ncbi:hypothetical protein BIW11_09573 [Tropilaelaps mercedesae]|uniref:Uncharacterized protein n=1 Tax=Tropilaelaps mercedesae TaxID=418985 RepID=A0A1V9XJY1_9ACAR|nr:hypothetical protein BIW11_09573 [Tropilaelaps mercedesae]
MSFRSTLVMPGEEERERRKGKKTTLNVKRALIQRRRTDVTVVTACAFQQQQRESEMRLALTVCAIGALHSSYGILLPFDKLSPADESPRPMPLPESDNNWISYYFWNWSPWSPPSSEEEMVEFSVASSTAAVPTSSSGDVLQPESSASPRAEDKPSSVRGDTQEPQSSALSGAEVLSSFVRGDSSSTSTENRLPWATSKET